MRTWADVGLLVALGAAVWLLIRLLPRRASGHLALYALAVAITSAGAVAIGVRREHRELTVRSVAVIVVGMCVVWLLAWTQRPTSARATARDPRSDDLVPRAHPDAGEPSVRLTRRERRAASRRHLWFRRSRPRVTTPGEDLDPEPA